MSKYSKNIFYGIPSFSAKELYNSKQTLNDEALKYINDSLVELKKDINRKIVPENENPEKIVNVVEKILNFNNKQKTKGRSRMLTSHPPDLPRVAKVFVCKLFNRKVSLSI